MARVEEQRPPVSPRVFAVLAVTALGMALGVAVFLGTASAGLRPWRYPGLAPMVPVSYTVVVTLLGALAWRLVRRRARHPRAVLARSVAVLAVVSLGADVVAGATGRWLVGLLPAAQHVVVLAATVAVLCWAMPVPPDDGSREVPAGWASGLGPLPRGVLAVVLVVAAGVWVLVNKVVEGPTLLVITARHGLTVADLFSVAALVLAGHLLRPARPCRTPT